MPTSVKRKNENIIDFDERRRYKSLEEQSDSNTERWYLVEIYNKLQEIANSNYKVLSKKLSEEHIIELEKENEMLKKKIKKSFPVHIMFYSIISSIIYDDECNFIGVAFCIRCIHNRSILFDMRFINFTNFIFNCNCSNKRLEGFFE